MHLRAVSWLLILLVSGLAVAGPVHRLAAQVHATVCGQTHDGQEEGGHCELCDALALLQVGWQPQPASPFLSVGPRADVVRLPAVAGSIRFPDWLQAPARGPPAGC